MTHAQTNRACRTCARRLESIALLLVLWGVSASIPLLAQFSFDHPLIRWCQTTYQMTGGIGQTLGWAPTLLFLFGAIRSIWALARGIRASHRLMASLKSLRVKGLSEAYSGFVPAEIARQLWFIATPRPVALTVGLFRPRIVISDSAIAGLTGAEIQAVLLHERAHQQNRDPLRHLLWSALVEGFGFLPGFRAAVNASRSCAELRADRLAVSHMGGADALRQALLKMARRLSGVTPSVTAGFSDELILRARHLVGQDVSDSLPMMAGRPMLSLGLYAPAVLSLLLPVCLPK